MPLRVAEKDGFIYAVNGCGDCPLWQVKDYRKGCNCCHKQGNSDKPSWHNSIPVWCPLPEPGIKRVIMPDMKKIEDNLKRKGLRIK